MIKRLVKLFISSMVWIGDEITSFFHRVTGYSNTTSAVILYYHSVPEDQVQRFARQMDILVRNATPISLSDLSHFADDRGRRLVCVTSDDGYVSFAKQAIPVMISRQIPVTVFISTGSIGDSPLWVHGPNHRYAKERVIDEKEIKRLSAMPQITIGSHCVSHTRLTNLPLETIKKELLDSKNTLQDLTGKPIDYLSFPHGCFNNEVITISRDLGYSKVFSIEPRRCAPNTSDYISGRIEVDPNDWLVEFFLKIRGSYRWLARRHRQTKS